MGLVLERAECMSAEARVWASTLNYVQVLIPGGIPGFLVLSMRAAALVASRTLRVRGANRPAPTLFSYPGLTARPWHERDAAPFVDWVTELEAKTPKITEEYLRVRASGVPSDYEPEEGDHSQLHTGDEWHWASFIDRGRRRDAMWAQCPATGAALEAVPGLCMSDMPFAFAFFSTLQPGASIKPHYSPCNLRIRVHLPLVVPEPERCGIRVAGEARRWEVGKAMIFDDAFEHEVWNEGASARAVLLFDLWHWELSEDELSAIRAM